MDARQAGQLAMNQACVAYAQLARFYFMPYQLTLEYMKQNLDKFEEFTKSQAAAAE